MDALKKDGAMTSNKPDPYATDSDNPEWTKEDFKSSMTSDEFEAKTGIVLPRRGRPKSENKKIHTGLRLDADVLEYFKKDGRGWQSRINAALRQSAGLK